jgi:23S rRNA pseudouridine2605 synthase
MSTRLNKLIAEHGLASRRGADMLIADGRVQVDGKTVVQLGTLIEEGQSVTVDGQRLTPVKTITYLLHKPRGAVSSRVHQANEPIVTELVPAHPPVYPVGRLDKESEGLLLLSNDGALTQRLTHPSFEHEKEYQVYGTMKEGFDVNQAATQLRQGIMLKDGKAKADHVQITLKDEYIILTITVHEGRTHLVRRMCGAVGFLVQKLVRTRLASLTLGSLKPGEWRILSASELEQLA